MSHVRESCQLGSPLKNVKAHGTCNTLARFNKSLTHVSSFNQIFQEFFLFRVNFNCGQADVRPRAGGPPKVKELVLVEF